MEGGALLQLSMRLKVWIAVFHSKKGDDDLILLQPFKKKKKVEEFRGTKSPKQFFLQVQFLNGPISGASNPAVLQEPLGANYE